ncbi:MAG: hypothetical protein IJO64_02865 [Clostridia bacterium]|nr:hypothetical protein [Clostridia bacterium]
MDLKTIIWMFMIGVAVATIVVYYNSRFLGRTVRALLDIDATSPQSAITLEELGLSLTPALRSSLKPGTAFSQIVIKTEDDRYYIAPDKVSLAKAKYRGKDITIVFVILTLVILAVCAFAMTFVFPETIENLSNQLSNLFGGGGTTR